MEVDSTHARLLSGAQEEPEEGARAPPGGGSPASRGVHNQGLPGLAVFSATLLAGYVAYRLVGCHALGWECNTKDIVSHYEDVLTMWCIGGLIFVTGPACDVRTLGRALLVFFSTLWCFAAIGQIPWMQNSLGDSSVFAPPAAYLYVPAVCIVAALLVYTLAHGCRRKAEAGITAAIITAIVGVYGAAAAIAFVPSLRTAGTTSGGPGDEAGSRPISLHLHHYSLAWNLTLLFRERDDPPSTLIRWMLLGVFVQGMAAYGPAGTLLESGSASSLIGV